MVNTKADDAIAGKGRGLDALARHRRDRHHRRRRDEPMGPRTAPCWTPRKSLKDRVAILDGPSRVDVAEVADRAPRRRASPPTTPGRRRRHDRDARSRGKGPMPGLRAWDSDGGYGATTSLAEGPATRSIPDAAPRPDPALGAMAGIYARTDSERGVHKASGQRHRSGKARRPDLHAVEGPSRTCSTPSASTASAFFTREVRAAFWGARTACSFSASNWCYLNVRRLYNMIEESSNT